MESHLCGHPNYQNSLPQLQQIFTLALHKYLKNYYKKRILRNKQLIPNNKKCKSLKKLNFLLKNIKESASQLLIPYAKGRMLLSSNARIAILSSLLQILSKEYKYPLVLQLSHKTILLKVLKLPLPLIHQRLQVSPTMIGATSAESSLIPAKRQRPLTESKQQMVSITLRLHLSVTRSIINLRSHTLRSSTHSHAAIAERKKEKNGKSNLDRKNLEETSSTNANNKSSLNKPVKKWKAIIRVVIVAKGNNGTKEGNPNHGNHRRPRIVEALIVITHNQRNKLICKLKN